MNVFACIYFCVPHVYLVADGGQKMVSDPLELEFHMVFSLHMGSENQMQFLCQNSKYS